MRIPNGSEPEYSPDGTALAYILGGQVYVSGPYGNNPVQLTTDPQGGLTSPTWSPDGSSLLFVTPGHDLNKVDVATKTVTNVVPNSAGAGPVNATWQPVRTNYVDRVFGGNAIQTGVAASQYAFADAGVFNDSFGRKPAYTVVLTRSDAYYDALAGSALAIAKNGPLLITPPTTLNSEVLAEIKRVLGPSGTIYVLGGGDALSFTISNQLTSLGYSIKRLAGGNMFETNILINREITPHPRRAIVATGLDFYDALAAGAAAGNWSDTVVVLTTGNTMPKVAADYLSLMNPDMFTGTDSVYAAGGWGFTALMSAWTERADFQLAELHRTEWGSARWRECH